MIINTFDNIIDIEYDSNMELNDIYNIIYKKIDDINNINSIILLCDNTIINDKNVNDYKDKNIYLYIDKHKNINKKTDCLIHIQNILKNLFESGLNVNEDIDYSYNLDILIEMGYNEEESYSALELNNNDIFNSINYLLDN